ncbi:calcium-binding protein [Caballeronia arvi]|nr:calcium-binding protein [Caballeronia arvi]
MDAVQAWDSEIFTAGACQKTVNLSGDGEFTRQVAEFKVENEAAYQRLFEACGWSVTTNAGPTSSSTMYYRDLELTRGRDFTGPELYDLMRVGCTEETRGKKVRHRPLASIANAVVSPEFQDKQVRDFVARLRLVVGMIPRGYSFRVRDYFQTDLGRAAALDQHVNRPNNVRPDIGAALDTFFRAHPSVDRDPSRWGEARAAYESEILSHYSQVRRMNQGAARFSALRGRLA